MSAATMAVKLDDMKVGCLVAKMDWLVKMKAAMKGDMTDTQKVG